MPAAEDVLHGHDREHSKRDGSENVEHLLNQRVRRSVGLPQRNQRAEDKTEGGGEGRDGTRQHEHPGKKSDDGDAEHACHGVVVGEDDDTQHCCNRCRAEQENTPERNETAGESRPTRKTKYMPMPSERHAQRHEEKQRDDGGEHDAQVAVQAAGRRLEVLPETIIHVDRTVATGRLPHDRDGGLADAEELRVGVVDAHANGEPRREMHPVECALDVGQAVRDPAVLRENSVANALDVAIEAAVGVAHQIDVDVCADGDVLELGLAVVGDDVPGACIDESEYSGVPGCA